MTLSQLGHSKRSTEMAAEFDLVGVCEVGGVSVTGAGEDFGGAVAW